MSDEKARDLFSAYHEGKLESGLKLSFENAIASNPSLQEEFVDFCVVFDDLSILASEEVVVPDDLHETISRRLDRHIFEKREKLTTSPFSKFRTLALGGVAVLLIGFTVVSFRLHNGQATGAGFIGSISPAADLEIKMEQNAPHLVWSPSNSGNVTVTALPSGQLIQRTGAKYGLDKPLANTNSQAVLFGMQIDGSSEQLIVAVPGTEHGHLANESGHGTLEDFALAIANQYGITVALRVSEPQQSMGWTLSGGSALGAANTNLKASGLVADVRNSGVLYITGS